MKNKKDRSKEDNFKINNINNIAKSLEINNKINSEFQQ